MKKIITTYILLSGLIIANYAQAEVIELNMQDATICKSQLLKSKDAMPILMEYSPECKYSRLYQPVYEAVAAKHPERTFFLAQQWEATAQVKANCLGETSMSLLPRTRLLYKITYAPTGEQIVMNSFTVKTGMLSEKELEKLIIGQNLANILCNSQSIKNVDIQK